MDLIFSLIFFLVIYIPYIIFMGIFAMIMWTITTEKIGSKILKTLIIIVILLYGSIIIVNFKTETPDNLYTEIKEINDDQSLIGLSSEEVIKLLGEPKHKYSSGEDKKRYIYSAGEIFKESYWGYSYSHEYYVFYVSFDENDKVENTFIKESSELYT